MKMAEKVPDTFSEPLYDSMKESRYVLQSLAETIQIQRIIPALAVPWTSCWAPDGPRQACRLCPSLSTLEARWLPQQHAAACRLWQDPLELPAQSGANRFVVQFLSQGPGGYGLYLRQQDPSSC